MISSICSKWQRQAGKKTLSLPQSQWLWSPLPPLLVWLGLVAQACCWHQSQSACTARWGAANWPAPLHPCQDSTAPFRRGQSLRPGWNTGGWVKRSQELSGKKIQRTGRVGRWFWRRKHQRTGSASFHRFQKERRCGHASKFQVQSDLLPWWSEFFAKMFLNNLLLGSKARIKNWPQFELIGKMTWWFVPAI